VPKRWIRVATWPGPGATVGQFPPGILAVWQTRGVSERAQHPTLSPGSRRCTMSRLHCAAALLALAFGHLLRCQRAPGRAGADALASRR